MAYDADIRYKPTPRGVLVTVLESDVQASSVTPPITVPPSGTIVRARQVLVSGDADTVDGELGESPSWTADGIGHVAWLGLAPSAPVNSERAVPYYVEGGKLYLRSTPDAGTNNVVRTEILIEHR